MGLEKPKGSLTHSISLVGILKMSFFVSYKVRVLLIFEASELFNQPVIWYFITASFKEKCFSVSILSLLFLLFLVCSQCTLLSQSCEHFNREISS